VIHRIVAALGAVAVLSAGLTAVVPAEAAHAESAVTIGTEFDAGLILTDAQMRDFSSMSVAQIQSFLDSKVPTCMSGGTGVPCLKDYRGDTVDTSRITDISYRCASDLPAREDQSAAQIIHDVALACQINPQVLLVTLQKEQGLVTKAGAPDANGNPTLTERNYQYAMGANCPDSTGCDPDSGGFFTQVYMGATKYNSFMIQNGYNYHVGVQEILYHPRRSCGTKTVNIRSVATAVLYTYTPYTPNQAALDAYLGLGNECSSYGNRNFWVYYTAWFGSTGDTPPYFVRAQESNDLFMVVDGKRRPVENAKQKRALAAAFAVPGTVTTIPEAIVEQIGRKGADALVPGSVVASSASASTVWVIDGLSAKRAATRQRAEEFTGSRSVDIVSAKTLKKFDTLGGKTTLGLRVDGAAYFADRGTVRAVQPGDAAHYPAAFRLRNWDAATARALGHGARIGKLLKNDGDFYRVKNDKKRQISTSTYRKLSSKMGVGARAVDDYFLSYLATRG
jgi:hypothetical protein